MMKFEFNWVEEYPYATNPPEFAVTMAEVTIRAGNSIITKHRDTETNEVKDFLFVQIYPMAEELAYWLYYDKEDLHSILGYGDGNIYPYISFKMAEDKIGLKWEAKHHENSYVEFLESGSLIIGIEEFEETAFAFCNKVLERLIEKNVRNTELENYLKKIT